MSRIGDAFARARREQRAALVIYLCAGDPDLDTTLALMTACAEAGADVIELGMPFSDPTADGPVIQRAAERALKSGTTLRGVLETARKLRARSDVGLVLFGYYNPLLAFGEQAIAAAAREAGIDGFLVVDLPPEEAESFLPALAAHGLDFVPLVAPTTPEDRVARIARTAGSFLYYVSLTGVTGASTDLALAATRAAALRERTGLPVALGFGVKTPADARVVAQHADGVVVGAAVCLAIEQAKTPEQAVSDVRELVRSLRAACDRTAKAVG
jgi:tryptophan synthase alpha chain